MGTVPERRSRMKRVLEVIGATPIASVTREQIEDVRDMLDEQIEDPRTPPTSRSPRRTMRARSARGSSRACRGRRRSTRGAIRGACSRTRATRRTWALHARKDDPTAGVKPPKKGATKAKAVLYSDEATTLLACGDVPVKYRAPRRGSRSTPDEGGRARGAPNDLR